MSRVLKFRAWLKPRWEDDEEANKMYYDIQNSYDTLGNVKPYDIMNSFDQWLDNDVAIVEQFTGLKDKNGVEVYEGDILGGMFEGCYIGWCDTTKSFELFNCFEHYCMACDGDILWCELSDSGIDIEVIGNIHDNPELLGGKE